MSRLNLFGLRPYFLAEGGCMKTLRVAGKRFAGLGLLFMLFMFCFQNLSHIDATICQ